MKEKNNKLRYIVVAFITLLGLILLDQWTKQLATWHLKNQEAIPIIPNVFELHYLENRGAAFGLFDNQILFFVISALFMIVICIYLFLHTPKTRRFFPFLCLTVTISAGAIGNFIDRVKNGFVVDFFYFMPINFPIFNVADIYVTISVFVLAFLVLFYYKEEELDAILPNFMKSKTKDEAKEEEE